MVEGNNSSGYRRLTDDVFIDDDGHLVSREEITRRRNYEDEAKSNREKAEKYKREADKKYKK